MRFLLFIILLLQFGNTLKSQSHINKDTLLVLVDTLMIYSDTDSISTLDSLDLKPSNSFNYYYKLSKKVVEVGYDSTDTDHVCDFDFFCFLGFEIGWDIPWGWQPLSYSKTDTLKMYIFTVDLCPRCKTTEPRIEDTLFVYTSDSTFQIKLDVSEALRRVSTEEEPSLPTSFSLTSIYPNPFNPETTVQFELHESQTVSFEVFSLLGVKVGDVGSGFYSLGTHSIRLDASDWASGTYVLRMIGGEHSVSRQFTVVK